ncbi:hypothetical protein DX185_17680 [Salmonella enterica]|nr:hypothetical protein [Salmonella enterica]ECL4818258.1 hypothetical protein [Salmonella enterica]EHJ8320785.1 hypothetical protein [Salmonella enterica subsp. enterica serovar Infantis]
MLMNNKRLFILFYGLAFVSSACYADYVTPGGETPVDITVEADDHAPMVTFTPTSSLSPSVASASNSVLGTLDISYDVDVTGTFTCVYSEKSSFATDAASLVIKSKDGSVKAYGRFYDAAGALRYVIPDSNKMYYINGYYGAYCAKAEPSVTYTLKHYSVEALPPGEYTASVIVANFTP